VCPSQALFFGTREQIEQLRPMSAPVNRFQFGAQTISTQVHMMVPRAAAAAAPWVDVTAAMQDAPRERTVMLRVLSGPVPAPGPGPDTAGADPFADVAVSAMVKS
jgi:hypothetical protein